MLKEISARDARMGHIIVTQTILLDVPHVSVMGAPTHVLLHKALSNPI